MQTQKVIHIPITIPQMGEGLVEARIVTVLKRAGEAVQRDEPLLEVETDKAVMVIESPVEGVVEKWEAKEDDVLPIGALVATILCQPSLNTTSPGTTARKQSSPPLRARSQAASPDTAPATTSLRDDQLPGGNDNGKIPHAPPAADATGMVSGGNRISVFSPRVRLYCHEHGVSAEEMHRIPRAAPDQPLRIADVERWLHARSAGMYQDRPLSPRHHMMASRLSRARREAVPAVAEIECHWDVIEEARGHFRVGVDDVTGMQQRPSSLTLIAWCVTKAMEHHARFRSALISGHTLREYKHVHLGIAVGMPDDELTTALVPNADSHEFNSFVAALQASIKRAREGYDAAGPMQLIVTKLSRQNIRHAIPMVVPPAVGTLFIGAPYDVPCRTADDGIAWKKVAQMVLTFDHRIINGLGAAAFLQEVQERIANLPKEFADERDQ